MTFTPDMRRCVGGKLLWRLLTARLDAAGVKNTFLRESLSHRLCVLVVECAGRANTDRNGLILRQTNLGTTRRCVSVGPVTRPHIVRLFAAGARPTRNCCEGNTSADIIKSPRPSTTPWLRRRAGYVPAVVSRHQLPIKRSMLIIATKQGKYAACSAKNVIPA